MNNMENRESVYTQLASSINDFAEHKLNKVELYNHCVELIEMADEKEKNDRLDYEKFWEEHPNEIMAVTEIPYSNWNDGLERVSE